MKLHAGRIFDAMQAIVKISERNGAMPMLAKYRFTVLHNQLTEAFTQIEAKRSELVQTYGEEKFRDPEKTQSLGWGLFPNDEKFPLYLAAWNTIRAEEFDLKVKPIPLAMLGNDQKGGIEISEFSMLGELILDNTEPSAEPAASPEEPPPVH